LATNLKEVTEASMSAIQI